MHAGRGIHGAVIPGCPETFESAGLGQSQGQGQGQEKHQKVREIRQGDIVAVPAGVAQWLYNNGDSPLVVVSFVDVGNKANQLDLSARVQHITSSLILLIKLLASFYISRKYNLTY